MQSDNIWLQFIKSDHKQKTERIGTDTLRFSARVPHDALALPLGELSPQVTERVMCLSNEGHPFPVNLPDIFPLGVGHGQRGSQRDQAEYAHYNCIRHRFAFLSFVVP